MLTFLPKFPNMPYKISQVNKLSVQGLSQAAYLMSNVYQFDPLHATFVPYDLRQNFNVILSEYIVRCLEDEDVRVFHAFDEVSGRRVAFATWRRRQPSIIGGKIMNLFHEATINPFSRQTAIWERYCKWLNTEKFAVGEGNAFLGNNIHPRCRGPCLLVHCWQLFLYHY